MMTLIASATGRDCGVGMSDSVIAPPGLKRPQFRQDGGQFVQTLWRPVPVVTPQAKQPESQPESSDLPVLHLLTSDPVIIPKDFDWDAGNHATGIDRCRRT